MQLTIRSILLFFLLAYSTYGKSEPIQFSAQADARSVLVGRTIEVRFVLTNAQGNAFSPPKFDGFKVLNGPSQQFSSTFINGSKSYSEAYIYILQAVSAGKKEILAASIRVDGKEMRTKPIEVEVILKAHGTTAGALPPNSDDTPVFITTELSKREVFEGEQIQVAYRIYTRVGIEGIDILSEPSYDGFFTRQLQRYDKRKTTKKIGNYEYTTSILAATTLFPMRKGVQTIEPLSLQAGMVQNQVSKDPFRSVFGRNIKPIVLTTNPVQIMVKALPTPPKNFSGAVGLYSLEADIEKKDVPAGSSTTLKLKIVGNGDQRRIELPKIELPSSFETYNPKPGLGEEYETLDEIRHEQSWELFVLPQEQGTFDLQPQFCYFNTDSAAYVSVTSILPAIKVGPPDPNVQNPNLSALKTVPSSNSSSFSRLLQSPVLWAALLLPLFFFGIFILLKKQKSKPATQLEKTVLSPKETRVVQTPPPSIVNPNLSLIELHTLAKNKEDIGRFYSGLQETLLKSSHAKLGESSTLDRKSLIDALYARHENTEVIQELDTLLETCEKAVYGGWRSTDSQDVLLARAASVLKRLG